RKDSIFLSPSGQDFFSSAQNIPQPHGPFFPSLTLNSSTTLPMLLDPFLTITSTIKMLVENTKILTEDVIGWDTGQSTLLQGSRVMMVKILRTQSESIQSSVLEGRELYVVSTPEEIQSANIVPGDIKIANLYGCVKQRPAAPT